MTSLIRNGNVLQRYLLSQALKNYRCISTSKKTNDTVAATCEPTSTASKAQETNWVSYGFDYTDKDADTSAHHASFFFSVTLCIVFGGFFWAYAPDVHDRDWSQREAFLELYRREKAGKPLIDPNYIDPAKMKVPSDEELEGVEIII